MSFAVGKLFRGKPGRLVERHGPVDLVVADCPFLRRGIGSKRKDHREKQGAQSHTSDSVLVSRFPGAAERVGVLDQVHCEDFISQHSSVKLDFAKVAGRKSWLTYFFEVFNRYLPPRRAASTMGRNIH